MKKRSMLAIASLAAGVVTALITPPPQASAAETPLGLGGATGLLQEDGAGAVLHETVTNVQHTVADGSGQGLR
ncbi:hypothetical protein [Streptomyces termitum]|uniref:hypothetical protein n=1 Tax=Streptomyces termitum TaxID=67368 RepID=UPI0033A269ED